MITLSDYGIDLTVIGGGSQAKLVQGNHIVTHEPVAVKVYSLKTYANLLCFENEARLLAQCRKMTNIIEAKACFTYNQLGFLIMPFYPQDLLSKIMQHNGLGEHLSCILFKQICEGLASCHEAHIAHLDLKPDNILYDYRTNKISICDFGNSFQFARSGELLDLGRRGTLVYCAPEIKNKQPYDPEKADIWSLGVLLHVMVAGYFPHSKNDSDMDNYHRGLVNLAFIQRDCSPLLIDLLTTLLNIVPTDRPSVRQILQHPWFNLFNPETQQQQQQINAQMVNGTNQSSIAHKISDRIFGTSTRRRSRS